MTSQSLLDIYLIYFDKLQHKLFYNCKVLEKDGFKKTTTTFQSYSFGDQQLTEPLLHRHIHSLIYFNNTFNNGNGLSHRVDKQRLTSSHQFKLQKEHKSRMNMRLSSLSHQYEQLQCTLDYYKNSIITTTLFTMRLQLRSGKSPTKNYSIYFAMFIQVIPVKSYQRVTFMLLFCSML